MNVCKQCPTPLCVKNCPTGACHISAENGNIRMIDAEKCIGCKTCIKICPHTPHRTIWNPKTEKATKCDLCTNTPFFNKKGGVDGAQACVEACPANALKVVTELPSDRSGGYDRNLQPREKPTRVFHWPLQRQNLSPKGKGREYNYGNTRIWGKNIISQSYN